MQILLATIAAQGIMMNKFLILLVLFSVVTTIDASKLYQLVKYDKPCYTIKVFLTTKIVSRSNGIFSFKVKYSTKAKMGCTPGTRMKARNINDAKRECQNYGSDCGMFYTHCRKGDTFHRCPKGGVQIEGGCRWGGNRTLYIKDNLGGM